MKSFGQQIDPTRNINMNNQHITHIASCTSNFSLDVCYRKNNCEILKEIRKITIVLIKKRLLRTITFKGTVQPFE
jgi:hypothetical protein